MKLPQSAARLIVLITYLALSSSARSDLNDALEDGQRPLSSGKLSWNFEPLPPLGNGGALDTSQHRLSMYYVKDEAKQLILSRTIERREPIVGMISFRLLNAYSDETGLVIVWHTRKVTSIICYYWKDGALIQPVRNEKVLCDERAEGLISDNFIHTCKIDGNLSEGLKVTLVRHDWPRKGDVELPWKVTMSPQGSGKSVTIKESREPTTKADEPKVGTEKAP